MIFLYWKEKPHVNYSTKNISQCETVWALSTKATHFKVVFLLPEGSRNSFPSGPWGGIESPLNPGDPVIVGEMVECVRWGGSCHDVGRKTPLPAPPVPTRSLPTFSPSHIDLKLGNTGTSLRIRDSQDSRVRTAGRACIKALCWVTKSRVFPTQANWQLPPGSATCSAWGCLPCLC